MAATIYQTHPLHPDSVRLWVDRKRRGNGVIEAAFLVGETWTPMRVVGRTSTQVIPADVLRKTHDLLITMQQGGGLPAPKRMGRPKTKFAPDRPAAKPKPHLVVDGTFEAAAALVIRDLRAKRDAEAELVGKTSDTLHRYSKKINEIKRLCVHFGPMRVKDIGSDQAMAYCKAYKNKNGTEPKASTLGNLRTAFRTVLERAAVEKWRSFDGIPTFSLKKRKKADRRDAIDPADLRLLLDFMSLSWAMNSKRASTRLDRQLCRGFIALAVVTGSRPSTELSRLRWRHIDEPSPANPWWVITVRGKTDIRETTPDQSLINVSGYIRALRELTGDHPDNLVFARPGTDHVPHDNFMRYFDQAKTKLGLGERVTLYSIRHYYATHLLNNGFAIHAVAKILGTSVQMIEKHYGHILSRDYAQQIKGLGQRPAWNPYFDAPDQPGMPERIPEYDF